MPTSTDLLNTKSQMDIEEVKGGGGVVEDAEISTLAISNLPTEVRLFLKVFEIQTEILSYLDTHQLFLCRLVSTQWNEISSRLLQDKQKDYKEHSIIIWFDEIAHQYICTRGLKSKQKKSLQQFIDCFFNSPIETTKTKIKNPRLSPFPFSRFHFDDIEHCDDFTRINFFTNFGSRCKSVGFSIKEDDSGQSVIDFWTLLLKYAPNIQHLSLEGGGRWLSQVSLFNYSETLKPQNQNQEVEEKEEETFIKNLKTLKIPESATKECPKFIQHILKHLPKLQEILPLNAPHMWKVDHLKFWGDLNKLHLIKRLTITKIPEEDLNLLSSSSFLSNLHLHSLNLECNSILLREPKEPEEGQGQEDVEMEMEREVSESEKMRHFIDKIYESSKNTLHSLTITMKAKDSTEIKPNAYFRQLTLPSVRQVCLVSSLWNIIFEENKGIHMKKLVEQIGGLCPQTSHLKLDSLVQNFPEVAPAIWTHFKQLKSLFITIDMRSKENSYSSLDQAFTGYSIEAIERMKKKLQETSLIPTSSSSSTQVKGEEDEEPELRTASFLDLKYLNQVEIRFYTATVNTGKPSSEEKTADKNENEKENKTAEEELRQLLFVRLMPQNLRENPRSLQFYDEQRKYIPLFP